jgi:glycosyltransferase involved in cell wall biosynthesis
MSVSKFSVLMSVYKGDSPKFLTECFLSLKNQALSPNELILIEDGPISSELEGVINKFRNELKIISVKLKKNVGLGAALNKGLVFCSYDLIARMDADDIAIPERFKKQVKYMDTYLEVSASSGAVEEFNEQYETTFVRSCPSTHGKIINFSKKRSPLNHPATIFRKGDIESVGGYPALRRAQDYALWSILIVNGFQLGNLPDVLVRMRSGERLLQRRGVGHFKQEMKLLEFQRKIGFLTYRQYIVNKFSRFILRLSPIFVKSIFYKVLR